MPRERKRILVVDDETLVAEVTTELLRDRCEVIAVHDGASPQVLRSCSASERFTPAVLGEARRRSSTDSFGDDVTVVSARLG